MSETSCDERVQQIHASGRQLVIALTGGGSGAISALLQVPGASASILEAIVPYAAKSLRGWLGGSVGQYCSETTARAMAMRSFERAREISDSDPRQLIGVGATASLASNRPKRGAHRIHVAWQSADVTSVVSCHFEASNGSRAEEELASTEFILAAIAEACNIDAAQAESVGLERVGALKTTTTHWQKTAQPEWSELLLAERASVAVPDANLQSPPRVLFPGAFNPPHEGHEQMARIATKRLGQPVTFELSIANVDKPPLDFIEINGRLRGLAGQRVLLTRAPTFVEKSRIAPGCTFVVGVDTIERIGDPVYYGNDPSQRDGAIQKIAARGCRFLVFGRNVDGRFRTLAAANIPPALRAICDEVTESEFSVDISSTALRRFSQG
jgi:hypothetical protein